MDNLLTIVVLYGMDAEESLALKSLTMNREKYNLNVIVYNNDSRRVINHNDFDVVNAGKNDGLAKAYNYGLLQAKTNGYKWLLLLDQDTEITDVYFDSLRRQLDKPDTADYVAVVPELVQGELHHSPSAYKRWKGVAWRCKAVNFGNVDVISDRFILTAFNSAMVVNVAKLNELGGFDMNYPLDMLDHRMCYLYYSKGLKIKLIDIQLEHHLSENEGMPIDRYIGYLDAHGRFAKSLGNCTLLMYKFRMLLRWVQLLLKREKKEIRVATLRAVIQSV